MVLDGFEDYSRTYPINAQRNGIDYSRTYSINAQRNGIVNRCGMY